MKTNKDFSKFNALKRLIAVMLIFAVIACGASFSQDDVLSNARDVESIDSLTGQRIGCVSGWETDMLLTGRNDITLMRYECTSDSIMALAYNQVDAVGMDESTWGMIKGSTTGLETLGEPIAHIGFIISINKEETELGNQFNSFNEAFQKTAEYEDYVSRAMYRNSDVFTNADIETVPEDKAVRTLKVGYNPENYPECYVNSVTGEMEGYGVEIMERFALQNNFAIEWIPGSSTSMLLDMESGKLDIFFDNLTDVFRWNYERKFIVPEPYMYGDVVIVKVAEGQTLKINGILDD